MTVEQLIALLVAKNLLAAADFEHPTLLDTRSIDLQSLTSTTQADDLAAQVLAQFPLWTLDQAIPDGFTARDYMPGHPWHKFGRRLLPTTSAFALTAFLDRLDSKRDLLAQAERDAAARRRNPWRLAL